LGSRKSAARKKIYFIVSRRSAASQKIHFIVSRKSAARKKIHFIVSRRSAAGRKFIFQSPAGQRLAGNLFSGLPPVSGWLEIYFPVSRQSAASRKFIFQSPAGLFSPSFPNEGGNGLTFPNVGTTIKKQYDKNTNRNIRNIKKINIQYYE
jgi:hypothetical protein